jgi:hypothetical protein
MEAFQSERDSEVSIIEEQRRIADETKDAAHAAAIQATIQANEAKLREFQDAADTAVRNVMDEIKMMELKVVEHKRENIDLRRSLDEAIHRLQTNQEDVIDRSLMKNILLDWIERSGKERMQVLEIMASVLKFSDEEKSKVGVRAHQHHHGPGALHAVVDAVAAPLPHSVNVEELDGENVREKWVAFLLAETGGLDSPSNDGGASAGGGDATRPDTKNNGSSSSAVTNATEDNGAEAT